VYGQQDFTLHTYSSTLTLMVWSEKRAVQRPKCIVGCAVDCTNAKIWEGLTSEGCAGKEGKGAVSQKQQLRVMRAFRAGGANALVATCVAEEGLDVGQVDLILCFDVSSRSPVRLVQRYHLPIYSHHSYPHTVSPV
jgi:ERCC4-related helicase